MANFSDSEKLRIDNLISTGKITAEDHKHLMKALDGKDGALQNVLSLMINPFEKVSNPLTLLAIGIFSILLMSFFGEKVGLHFHGVLDFQVTQPGKRAFTFPELLIQNVVDVILGSIVFFALAFASKCKNLRVLDFISFISVARLPYLLFSLFMFVFVPIFPSLIPQKDGPNNSPGVFVLAIVGMSFLAWAVTLLFSAEKVASGLRGKAIWINFIVGLTAAEALSIIVNNLILK